MNFVSGKARSSVVVLALKLAINLALYGRLYSLGSQYRKPEMRHFRTKNCTRDETFIIVED